MKETKRKLLDLLIDVRAQGKTVVGYGAPGKGNTLLNYCGIRADLLSFTVDRNPYKQGQFLPGTHVPIREPEAVDAVRAGYSLREYELDLEHRAHQGLVDAARRNVGLGNEHVALFEIARVYQPDGRLPAESIHVAGIAGSCHTLCARRTRMSAIQLLYVSRSASMGRRSVVFFPRIVPPSAIEGV